MRFTGEWVRVIEHALRQEMFILNTWKKQWSENAKIGVLTFVVCCWLTWYLYPSTCYFSDLGSLLYSSWTRDIATIILLILKFSKSSCIALISFNPFYTKHEVLLIILLYCFSKLFFPFSFHCLLQKVVPYLSAPKLHF